MNAHTPRGQKGSLLERAAEQFGYGMPPVRAPEPAAPEPAPAAPLPEPILELVPEPEPVLRRGFEAEAAPEPAPQPAPRGRGRVALDRGLLAEAGMIVPGGAVTPLAEEFRLVKRQLLQTARRVAAGDPARARMILVCSARPDEGKTFCAINLALSLAAEKDVEVLLVDGDFAKPDLPARLGIATGPGLLDALAGAIAVEDCIADTDVPQLAVLQAGTRSTDDTELLASEDARGLLAGLAAADPRRIVVFDSPPALAASPASVFADNVGQVLLVVRADRTSEADLREATGLLDACEHIQLLLNGVSFQPRGKRFGSYYGEPTP